MAYPNESPRTPQRAPFSYGGAFVIGAVLGSVVLAFPSIYVADAAGAGLAQVVLWGGSAAIGFGYAERKKKQSETKK